MNEISYVVVNVAVILIWVLQAAMFLRAIMSWIPGLDENKFGDFLYAITEPFILPVRAILDRIPLFQGFPLDMSFLFTYLLLSLLSMLLGGL
ncbi:MAG: YggT family protein [Clostridia bacterium]|nr:YggT family protein [Clostridia bacterium]